MFRLFQKRVHTKARQSAREGKGSPPKGHLVLPRDEQVQQEQREYQNWRKLQRNLIRELPWFGQNFSPAGFQSRRCGRQALTESEEDRLLLSWLAGGTSRVVGSRLGVNRRTVYNVLHRLVYTSDPGKLLLRWHRAGLYTCMYAPRYKTIKETGWQDLICNICHDVFGEYGWLIRDIGDKAGQTFTPKLIGQLAPFPWILAARAIQAHLIRHFWLDEDPSGCVSNDTAWSQLPDRVVEEALVLGSYARVYAAIGTAGVAEERWREWRAAVLQARKGPLPPPPAQAATVSG